MPPTDQGHKPIGRTVAVVVSLLCGVLAAVMFAATILVALLALLLAFAEHVDPAAALVFSFFLSISIPTSFILGVVAVRGLDAKEERLLSLTGWRSVMLSVLAVGIVLAVTFHPIALLAPAGISGTIYLLRDPSADWLRAMFGSF